MCHSPTQSRNGNTCLSQMYLVSISGWVTSKQCSKQFVMQGIGDFVAGGLGGLACVLAGQPFDTIKVKLQTYPHLYKSLYHAVTKTVSQEKLRGFYAGSAPAIFSNVAENAVLFLFYSQCQRVIQWAVGANSVNELSVFQQAGAGSLASVFSSIAITPPDRIKCMLQAHMQSIENVRHTITSSRPIIQPSAVSLTKQIIHQEGFFGLFRGLSSTWAREVPGYFLFFYGYNASKRLLTPEGQSVRDLSPYRLALAGGLAGCCFWTSVYPTDVVKSRIQVRGEYSASFWRTMLDIMKKEGFVALYKGLLPTVIRSFPANGALFVTYEYTRMLFQRTDQQSVGDSGNS